MMRGVYTVLTVANDLYYPPFHSSPATCRARVHTFGDTCLKHGELTAFL